MLVEADASDWPYSTIRKRRPETENALTQTSVNYTYIPE
jgi:hypothetical protein